MNKFNFIEAIDKTYLSERTKFRLEEISKYVAAFDYIDKILIVLSATTGGVSTCSFTSTVGAPVGIASANFTLIFALTTGITKRVLNITRKKKRKSMMKFLCWLKVNSIVLKH